MHLPILASHCHPALLLLVIVLFLSGGYAQPQSTPKPSPIRCESLAQCRSMTKDQLFPREGHPECVIAIQYVQTVTHDHSPQWQVLLSISGLALKMGWKPFALAALFSKPSAVAKDWAAVPRPLGLCSLLFSHFSSCCHLRLRHS